MTNITFHVGLPRTATTFLQSQIFNKLKHTQTYPKMQPPNIMHQTPNTIITNEMFSLTPNRYKTITQMKHLYPNAKLILGLRDYKTILTLLYNHLVTYGLPQTRKQWEQTQPKEIDTYITHVKTTFPNALIYQYDQFKQTPDAIIDKICEYLEQPTPKYTNKTINTVTRDKKIIEQIRQANTYTRSAYNPEGMIPRHIITTTLANEEEIIFTVKHPQFKQVTFTRTTT